MFALREPRAATASLRELRSIRISRQALRPAASGLLIDPPISLWISSSLWRNQRALANCSPIQTTINNTISVQYIDAVLKLEVTPQITAEGTIFMDVLVENTQIDQGIPRIQGVPALDTQAAETKVTVADGGTVVIGGVIISSQRVDINQTPIVGSLPLIGNLFKRRSVNTSSQELLFFLTPRIIPG
ncbi:MAG: hypothetical protein E6L07_15445 [Verrucomicrobia bacterium]|nr:MAG: hypothetical protein E6L07_15445 [Verrucomicrobiota bacterium]